MHTIFKIIHSESISGAERGVQDFIDSLEDKYDQVRVTKVHLAVYHDNRCRGTLLIEVEI